MTSYADGDIYVKHAVFAVNPNAIRLHFYIDEFEVCNPIGSKKGKHKVLGVYYLVGNMANKYCSEIKFINLCMLVKYHFIKQYDPHYQKLFSPLIKELKLLASKGEVNGTKHHFRAALATVSADNLSAHAIAGFQRHFNSGRICHDCMATN